MKEDVNKKWCPKCRSTFSYNDNEIKQDENSSYGSTKYVLCPTCGKPFILKVVEDSFDNNNDIRFVTYYRHKRR